MLGQVLYLYMFAKYMLLLYTIRLLSDVAARALDLRALGSPGEPWGALESPLTILGPMIFP